MMCKLKQDKSSNGSWRKAKRMLEEMQNVFSTGKSGTGNSTVQEANVEEKHKTEISVERQWNAKEQDGQIISKRKE